MSEPNESLMAALADFAAGAGHEINNPLAIISGQAQILLEKTRSPEEHRRLAAIIAQTKRAYEMIADLRLFACPPDPCESTFDLRTFLDELTSDYESLDAEYPLTVQIEWKMTNPPGNVHGDRQMLRMVFDALLQNAFEASDDKKAQVKVSVGFIDTSAPHWQITVSDNGPGITPEMRDRIFFPYCSGRDAGRGLGFGLPRSWALMKKMGGSLRLEECGFVVTLPARRE